VKSALTDQTNWKRGATGGGRRVSASSSALWSSCEPGAVRLRRQGWTSSGAWTDAAPSSKARDADFSFRSRVGRHEPKSRSSYRRGWVGVRAGVRPRRARAHVYPANPERVLWALKTRGFFVSREGSNPIGTSQ